MGICLLVALALAGGFAIHRLLDTPPSPAAKKIGRNDKSPHVKAPRFDVHLPAKQLSKPPKKFKKSKISPPPKKKSPTVLPQVAIIIDDVGYDVRMARRFIQLDKAFTLSVLPHSPFRKTIAKEAHAAGIVLTLHLPMEPSEYPKVNPGEGALLVSMAPDELIHMLNKNIDAVPHISGVNNHMGSKMTTMSTKMYQIFSILKKRNLFFIDSRTTAESLCKPSARLLKIPFAERDVFLDHNQTPHAIKYQLKRLVAFAYEKGQAIGIGHPYPETYQVLRKMLPSLKQKIRLVPISEVVHVIGPQASGLAKR
jgi:polysaccharide deacetylase 2 family uncharacterized protein YibQ